MLYACGWVGVFQAGVSECCELVVFGRMLQAACRIGSAGWSVKFCHRCGSHVCCTPGGQPGSLLYWPAGCHCRVTGDKQSAGALCIHSLYVQHWVTAAGRLFGDRHTSSCHRRRQCATHSMPASCSLYMAACTWLPSAAPVTSWQRLQCGACAAACTLCNLQSRCA